VIRFRRLLPAAALLALSATLTVGDPVAAAPAPPSTAPPCLFTFDCEPIVGAGATMAVPLFRPAVQGNDGGWTLPTMCCTAINLAGARTVTGVVNGKPAAIVPDGGSGVLGGSIGSTGETSIVYAVSGRSYRYVKYASSVSRSNFDLEPTWWGVTSDAYSWRCTQRGTRRDPVADCGTGTHQFTRGTMNVDSPPADPEDYSVTVPVAFSERKVDSRGRPLTTPYRRSTGSWTLRTNKFHARWYWTVDWTVAGIGTGHVYGAASNDGSRITVGSGLN
jgi:hypothetical protein